MQSYRFAETKSAHTVETCLRKTKNVSMLCFSQFSRHFLTTFGLFLRVTFGHTQRHFFNVLKDSGKAGSVPANNIAELVQGSRAEGAASLHFQSMTAYFFSYCQERWRALVGLLLSASLQHSQIPCWRSSSRKWQPKKCTLSKGASKKSGPTHSTYDDGNTRGMNLYLWPCTFLLSGRSPKCVHSVRGIYNGS